MQRAPIVHGAVNACELILSKDRRYWNWQEGIYNLTNVISADLFIIKPITIIVKIVTNDIYNEKMMFWHASTTMKNLLIIALMQGLVCVYDSIIIPLTDNSQ